MSARVVLVARDEDGVPMGCGALRAFAALESAAAASRGWTTLRLETGPLQPEALGLHTGAGYRSIDAFGAYSGDPDAVDSVFFERVLPGKTEDPLG